MNNPYDINDNGPKDFFDMEIERLKNQKFGVNGRPQFPWEQQRQKMLEEKAPTYEDEFGIAATSSLSKTIAGIIGK